ncbi:hypothetical protein DACRYDRAFT_20890 [Dacryopinax primogenitus]|uniref:Uncharacterized protein n=1 Tax=Dacryopinax primogenitus (strain DJM 731) TaxID=1858805 RepID=M5G294_DACPD|nr:uncharacterized protein DACRYDRAFT_20890 [Dacryopinax primogenitus]EJU04321.1 hypothetical protein DACRYDRAFT_20890 [Dacryopinax primogenitus]
MDNTHFIGFPNSPHHTRARGVASAAAHGSGAVTPPRTPVAQRTRPRSGVLHTPGGWPAQEEDDFHTSQESPIPPPANLDWPAARPSTPFRPEIQQPNNAHTPRTPSRVAVSELPRTPANMSTRSNAAPATPSYLTPVTNEQLKFLTSLPHDFRMSYSNELTSLAEHLKRQDRLHRAGEKTVDFRERKIEELKAELESCKRQLADLEALRQDPDLSDLQGLARRSAKHEAQIAELQEQVAALQGHRR